MVTHIAEQMTFEELTQRADKATEYCYDAIEARDWGRFTRAFWRLIERWAQWDALHVTELVDEFGPEVGTWQALQHAELLPRLQQREITAGDLLRAAGLADAPALAIATVDATWFGLVQRMEYGEQLPPDAEAFTRERVVSGYSEEIAAALFGAAVP